MAKTVNSLFNRKAMNKSTILLMEDESQNLDRLREFLLPLGYHLLYANDNEVALALVTEYLPDIVLISSTISGLDGLAFIRHLRTVSELAHIPIILLTPLDDDQVRKYGLKAGADTIVSTPIDYTELQACIFRMLEISYYRRQNNGLTSDKQLGLAGTVRELLQQHLNRTDVALLKVKVEASIEQANRLFQVGALSIPDIQSLRISTCELLMLVPLEHADEILQTLLDQFYNQPSDILADALISYGFVAGPFSTVENWLEALAKAHRRQREEQGLPVVADQQVVLLVDDNPQILSIIGDLLRPLGYLLISTTNGATALTFAADHQPDLVLLDIMMRGMDGFMVTRQLRNNPNIAHIPVVLVSALNDRESRVRGFEAGADYFISKPFDYVEFRAFVQTMLELGRYRRLMKQYEHVSQEHRQRDTENPPAVVGSTSILLQLEIIHLQQRRQLLEATIAQYREMLQKRDFSDADNISIAVNKITAVLNHDLGNGFTSIVKTLSVMPANPQLDPLSAEIKRSIAICSLWQRSIAEMGSDILAQQNRQSIDVLLDEIRELLLPEFAQVMELQVESTAGLQAVLINRQRLLMVVLHLIRASVSAGARWMTIRAEPANEGVVIIIADNGAPGVRSDILSGKTTDNFASELEQYLLLARRVLEQEVNWLRDLSGTGTFMFSCHLLSAPSVFGNQFDLWELRSKVASLEQEARELQTLVNCDFTSEDQTDTSLDSFNRARSLLAPLAEHIADRLDQLLFMLDEHVRTQSQQPELRRVGRLLRYCLLLSRNLAASPTDTIAHTTDVPSTVAEVIDTLAVMRAEGVNQELEPVPQVIIAPVELQQVIMNLVKNAIEATSEGEPIVVSTRTVGEVVQIDVRDYGRGIHEFNRDHLFSLNFSTRGRGTRSGIGLFAVEQLITRAGGNVAVASLPAQKPDARPWYRGFMPGEEPVLDAPGSLFRISLPTAKAIIHV